MLTRKISVFLHATFHTQDRYGAYGRTEKQNGIEMLANGTRGYELSIFGVTCALSNEKSEKTTKTEVYGVKSDEKSLFWAILDEIVEK